MEAYTLQDKCLLNGCVVGVVCQASQKTMVSVDDRYEFCQAEEHKQASISIHNVVPPCSCSMLCN